ncbi:Single-stranded DNA-binding protein [bacterium HR39]|nr:Single-stranded DNA-binding protein [bacterium HR39]
MADINSVLLVGRVGRDPEAVTTPNGTEVAHLSVATTERWKSAAGEQQERTEWHRVVVFKPGAFRFIRDYVGKGDLVLVRGKLQTRRWQDRDGNDRWTTEVVVAARDHDVNLLARKRGAEAADTAGADAAPQDGGGAAGDKGFDGLDDDIPF